MKLLTTTDWLELNSLIKSNTEGALVTNARHPTSCLRVTEYFMIEVWKMKVISKGGAERKLEISKSDVVKVILYFNIIHLLNQFAVYHTYLLSHQRLTRT